jgi:16S rRNA G966 N2-methylase RsmD
VSIRPIFIFSPPRTGSTLLQRVLASYPDVATASEPWVLLPLLGPLRGDVPGMGGTGALVHGAVSDFVDALPDGRAEYLKAMRHAALELYAAAAGRDEGWFVDKSPIYHTIVDEIVEAFPEGRFVFLWRNPLSIVASAVEMFDEGRRWQPDRHTMALYRSIEDLVPASERHAPVAHAVRFEDLVSGESDVWQRLAEYIGLSYDPATLERFGEVELHGRLGDTVGTRLYREVSQEPLAKWRRTIDTPVRKAWCRRYLLWIGRERLAQMGYELDALLEELGTADVSIRRAGEDVAAEGARRFRAGVRRVLPTSARKLGWRIQRRYQAAMRRLARAALGAGDLDTDDWVFLDDIGLDAPGRVHYQPSGYSWLWRGLRGQRITQRDVFLDYGCGKGRVVIQAAQRYPFGKVIGVDISEDLVRVARENLERARGRLKTQAVELVVADAETWPLPDEVTHVYMYRPFKGDLFARVMERVIESLDRRPRQLTLIYAYPEQDDVVLASGRFRRVRTSRGLDKRPHHSVNVYVSVPDAQLSGAG